MYIQSCLARWSFSLGLDDDNIPSSFIMSVHGDSIKLFANNLGCFSSSHLQFVYDLRRYLCAHRPIAHTHTHAHTPLVICISAAHFSRFHKIFAHIFMLPNDRCGYFVVIHAVPKNSKFPCVIKCSGAAALSNVCTHQKALLCKCLLFYRSFQAFAVAVFCFRYLFITNDDDARLPVSFNVNV